MTDPGARLLNQQSWPGISGSAPRLSPDGRNSPRVVGVSAAARQFEAVLQRVAAFDSTVLISGETGSGKEQVARALHDASSRSAGPFVAINCGAIAASLIESQLFGHEKGAFTGAYGSSRGVFRTAEGGTVLLDEIGELPLELQPRLLRVLQEREVTPVGSIESYPFDVRVIASTNRDLSSLVSKGAFREDLRYRLNTIEINVPPLRRRPEDIPLFIEHFSRLFSRKFNLPLWQASPVFVERFQRYAWPGNVRQLAQAVERVYAMGPAAALPDEDVQRDEDTPHPGLVPPNPSEVSLDTAGELLEVLNLDTLRRQAVRRAMALTNGHRGKAAKLLGVHLNTMTRLVEEALPAASRRRGARADRRKPTDPSAS